MHHPGDAERATLGVLKRLRLDGPAPDAAVDHVVRIAAPSMLEVA